MLYNVPKTSCHCISAARMIDTLSDIIELFDVVSTALLIFGRIESVTNLLHEHRALSHLLFLHPFYVAK